MHVIFTLSRKGFNFNSWENIFYPLSSRFPFSFSQNRSQLLYYGKYVPPTQVWLVFIRKEKLEEASSFPSEELFTKTCKSRQLAAEMLIFVILNPIILHTSKIINVVLKLKKINKPFFVLSSARSSRKI